RVDKRVDLKKCEDVRHERTSECHEQSTDIISGRVRHIVSPYSSGAPLERHGDQQRSAFEVEITKGLNITVVDADSVVIFQIPISLKFGIPNQIGCIRSRSIICTGGPGREQVRNLSDIASSAGVIRN